MRFNCQLINGIAFGIYHQYYLDLDKWFEEHDTEPDPEQLDRRPLIIVLFGPLQLHFAW